MNLCRTHCQIIARCRDRESPYNYYKKIVTQTPFTPLTEEQFDLAFDDMFMIIRSSDSGQNSSSCHSKKRKVNKSKLKKLATQLILLASQVLEELED